MRSLIATVVFLLMMAPGVFGQSTLYPFPSKWSYQDIASWTLPRPKLVETLPPVGNARPGDLLFLENNPAPILYSNNGSAWSLVGTTGSQSGGAGPFFQFMNVATTPFSIPVIGRMGSWTAVPFARVGSFGASLSDSPLYFCPSTGELGAVIASAGFDTWTGPLFLVPSAYVVNVASMFDGNYDTFATFWYDPSGGASGYPSIMPYYPYAAQNVTGIAMMFNDNAAVLPTSILVRGWAGSNYTNLWSGTGASAGMKLWYISASFTTNIYNEALETRFTPSSTVATSPWNTRWRRVEIAEFRFITLASGPSSVFGPDSFPKILPLLHPDPASATFDGFTVRGQTATPPGRVQGTMWLDTNLTPPRLKVWSGTAWTSL